MSSYDTLHMLVEVLNIHVVLSCIIANVANAGIVCNCMFDVPYILSVNPAHFYQFVFIHHKPWLYWSVGGAVVMMASTE